MSGDFNGDGLADLAFGAPNGTTTTLTVLLGMRQGGFVAAPGSPSSFGTSQGELVTADFNGDGNLDLAWAGDDLLILLGNGRGGFSLHSSIGARSVGLPGIGGIATGDLNHDGRQDLVLTASGYIAVLLGDGKGNFTAAPESPMRSQYSLGVAALADVNMDGSPDLAIECTLVNQAGGDSSFVLVLLNDGTGVYHRDPEGPFPTGLGADSIVHGDFNGDGRTDLATSNWEAGTVTILLGDGTGNFVRPPDIDVAPATTPQGFISGYVPRWLAVGDFNGDGNQDLAVAVGHNGFNSTEPYREVDIFLGNGLGGFAVPAGGRFTSPGDPFVMTLADFNGDGRLDVATSNFGGTA